MNEKPKVFRQISGSVALAGSASGNLYLEEITNSNMVIEELEATILKTADMSKFQSGEGIPGVKVTLTQNNRQDISENTMLESLCGLNGIAKVLARALTVEGNSKLKFALTNLSATDITIYITATGYNI